MLQKEEIKPYSVAVLLAAKNGARWLPQQIRSILAQKKVDISLYISIDHSDDNTSEIAEQYAATDSRITIIRHTQHFGTAAKNFFFLLESAELFIKKKSHSYISFADQDDIWSEEKTYEAICILEKQRASGYSSNATAYWENGRTKKIIKSYPQKQWDHFFEAGGPGCTYVFSRKLYEGFLLHLRAHRSLLEQLNSHDWAVYAYSRATENSWYIDERSFLLYRQHQNNALGANIGLLAAFRRIKQLSSGEYLRKVRLLTELHKDSNKDLFEKLNTNETSLFTLKNVKKMRRSPYDQALLFLFSVTRLLKK
ncbi:MULTISPECIES: glycosyltransferase [Pseudomonas]|uniref:glycosyltransferase n=1 Tax=Pseudomonas TaxID=286 RepID=UPI0009FC829E|nr:MULTISPECIES: glycosyltransferase [Pseudomonas]